MCFDSPKVDKFYEPRFSSRNNFGYKTELGLKKEAFARAVAQVKSVQQDFLGSKKIHKAKFSSLKSQRKFVEKGHPF